jgi:hypothetical protein
LSHLLQPHLTPEDFKDFSMDLEEMHVKSSDLAVIRNHAFRHVRGIKALDLSENKITLIENEAFTEVRSTVSPIGMMTVNNCYMLEASHWFT